MEREIPDPLFKINLNIAGSVPARRQFTGSGWVSGASLSNAFLQENLPVGRSERRAVAKTGECAWEQRKPER